MVMLLDGEEEVVRENGRKFREKGSGCGVGYGKGVSDDIGGGGLWSGMGGRGGFF